MHQQSEQKVLVLSLAN